MNLEISNILIDWYEQNRRDLPWRHTRDPYRIWLSEVILQQTRVAQGMDYYHRLTERFPDAAALAAAPEDEVLRHWQGLGYYSRARNLHAAAKQVVEQFGGRFPETYEHVRSLRGVGDYTAAAICSIAYDLPHAVVDGNVYRVLSRLFDLDEPIDGTPGKKAFSELAAVLLDPKRPGLHNQAVMEFGALHCLPRNPACESCPLSGKCLALAHGRVEQLPVKSPKTPVKPRYFNYFVIRCGGRILLSQRREKDIWQNLYEFPLIETPEAISWEALQADPRYGELFGTLPPHLLTERQMPPHLLSHRVIHARFYELSVGKFSPAMERYLQLDEAEIDRYAIPRLIESYLEKMK